MSLPNRGHHIDLLPRLNKFIGKLTNKDGDELLRKIVKSEVVILTKKIDGFNN